MDRVPPVVWMLWLQGWDEAPPLVRACARSWQRQPGLDVRLLDASLLADLVTVPDNVRTPQAISDYARVMLLREHGGMWADATLYCLEHPNQWLPQETGFFAFSRPGRDRPISSWFLASEPGGQVIAALARGVDEYWRARQVEDHYFWLHRLFEPSLARDPGAQAAWVATPKISARGPHYFAPYGRRFTGPMSNLTRARLSKPGPVYKLNHRETSGEEVGSAYVWFLNEAQAPLATSPIKPLWVDRLEELRWQVRDWTGPVTTYGRLRRQAVTRALKNRLARTS